MHDKKEKYWRISDVHAQGRVKEKVRIEGEIKKVTLSI